MDFHQLRVFVEAAKEKSFSRAAEKIFLSQPTVSAHIKSLEKEIGTLLFERRQRELKLTEAGKILLRYARELLDKKEEALAVIQKDTQAKEGRLEIAASSVPGAYLLPSLLQAFNKIYPGVTFSVLIRDTEQVKDSIVDFTYSLGFTGKPIKETGIEARELVKDRLILIASPGFAIPCKKEKKQEFPLVEPAACLKLPFVLREPGSATRMLFEDSIQREIPGGRLKTVAYLESQEAIKEAVKTGLGVTVISQRAVQGELEAGFLKGYLINRLNLYRSFYLIWRENRFLAPLTQLFLNFTLDYFSEPEENL